MPHQNATRSLLELFVWRPESIYHEGVGLTIFLVSHTNRRHYTKHTKNSIVLTYYAMGHLWWKQADWTDGKAEEGKVVGDDHFN